MRVLGILLAVVWMAGAPEPAIAACDGDDPGAQLGGRTVACAVNAVRRANGRAPLRWNARLAAAARGHASDMVRRGYFAHDSPDGGTLLVRVRAAGYLRGAGRWWLGENLAWASGPVDAGAIVAMWMGSPGHRALVLSRRPRALGAGVVPGSPSGADGVTVTLDLGRARRRA